MKCELEDPTGNSIALPLLVFVSRNLGKCARDCNVLIVGRFAVLPFDRLFMTSVERHVNCSKSVGKWEATKIEIGWEDLGVMLTNFRKHTRSWVHGREVIIGAEKTHNRHLRKLLKPLDNHQTTIVDLYAADEDIEAV